MPNTSENDTYEVYLSYSHYDMYLAKTLTDIVRIVGKSIFYDVDRVFRGQTTVSWSGARKPWSVPDYFSGRDAWRIRVGDYRVLYEIHDDLLLILVVDIGHS